MGSRPKTSLDAARLAVRLGKWFRELLNSDLPNSDLLDLKSYDAPRLVAVGLMSMVGLAYVLRPGEPPFTLLNLINLVPNQLGHLAFSLFGGFVSYFGGPVVQVAFPLSLFFYCFQLRKPFLASLALFWTAQSLFDLAHYAGDARTFDINLLTGSDHVWHTLLSGLGLLQLEQLIGALLYLSAVLIFVLSVILGLNAAKQLSGQ